MAASGKRRDAAPGDIELDVLTLTNFDGSESHQFKLLCLEFSIYESLAQDHLRAEFVISDGLALTSEMPIIGEETVEIAFRTPRPDASDENDEKNDLVTLTFKVVALRRLQQTSDRIAHYALECVHQRRISDSMAMFSKAYGPEGVHETVKKIAEDPELMDLKVAAFKEGSAQDTADLGGGRDDATMLVEAARGSGPQQWVIPMLSPMEALHFLASEAMHGENPASTFTLFMDHRNRGRLSWVDIDSLMQRETVQKYYVREQSVQETKDKDGLTPGAGSLTTPGTGKTTTGSVFDADDVSFASDAAEGKTGFSDFEYVLIRHIDFRKMFDIEKALLGGLFDNRVDYTDPLHRQFSTVPLGKLNDGGDRIHQIYYNEEDDDDFEKYWKVNKSLSGAINNSGIVDEGGQGEASSPVHPNGAPLVTGFSPYRGGGTSHVRYLFSDFNQTMDPRWAQKNPRMRPHFLPLEISSKEQLDFIIFEIVVPGDSNRVPGDVIEIALHKFGATDDVKFKLHQYLAGRWLVTSVRHKYTFNDSYSTVMEIVKNGYNEDIKNNFGEISGTGGTQDTGFVPGVGGDILDG